MTARFPDSLLKRGVAEVIIEQEMVKLLESGRPLRLKQGFDPSRPDIHLGHVVGLRKLRQFQELGHQVILIVGDWTAQIGDPSGQSVTRPMLTAEEVRQNAETYMQQFFKVVDKSRTEVRLQSEWFGQFTLADIIKLTSKFTVAQFLAREDFAKRYAGGQPIAITELLYPLLQAYDSVAIQADVEFGGVDQKFNCLVGRELQAMMGQRQQQVFLVPLLVGTDGVQKMSKSLGNYIGVDEPPYDMYGKVMSIPDDLIMLYFELLTDVPDEELADMKQQMEEQSVNPMNLKKRLAFDIVTQFHSRDEARKAEERFAREVQRKELPADMPERKIKMAIKATDPKKGIVVVSVPLLLVETSLVGSAGEGRRLIAQGAVEIDGERVTENDWKLAPGAVLRVGKRRFCRIMVDMNAGSGKG
ncbi:MAG: tyrosine--tRNA ligase [Dehalococcoidia bacterium]|nr:tyrosine--tRNA ligase [Dehalococcoidia bacterium]